MNGDDAKDGNAKDGVDVPAFGIFDGHGGDDASEALLFEMSRSLRSASSPSLVEGDAQQLKEVFLHVDEILLLRFEREYEEGRKKKEAGGGKGYRTLIKTTAKAKNAGCSGSTGTVLLIGKEKGRVGWVGDSRAIGMSRDGRVVEMTQDHKVCTFFFSLNLLWYRPTCLSRD